MDMSLTLFVHRRAGIITGRYQDKFGYGLNILYTPKDPKMGLPLSEYT